MPLNPRLLAAFVSLALFPACATQHGAQTQGPAASVEDAGSELDGATARAQPRPVPVPAGPRIQFNRIEAAEGFAVKLPAQPQVVRNKVTIPAGDVTTAAWTVNLVGIIYSISIADYPEKVVAARPAEALLEEAKQGLLAQVKGTIQREEAVTINSVYPGKVYAVSSEMGELRARNYVVGPRLYTMLVLYNPRTDSPQADDFLGSLELANPPPPVARSSPR